MSCATLSLRPALWPRNCRVDSPMQSESQVIVRPALDVRGSVSLPGDKSISHRYAMLAAIA
ncbi:MAG: hypothetical protein WBW70_13570, partial [Candidatus Sulfotelmatobacter sp.]